MNRNFWIASLIALSILFVAGCQSTGSNTHKLTMTDFAFTPETLNLQAGQEVQLTLINEGAVEHEILIGRNLHIGEDGKLEGFEEDFFDKGAVEVRTDGDEFHVGSPEEIEEEGWHVEVEPGGKVTLTFTVPAGKEGEWEIGCFVAGHYEAGMTGALVVK